MKMKDQRKARIRSIKIAIKLITDKEQIRRLRQELFLLRNNKTGSKHYTLEVNHAK